MSARVPVFVRIDTLSESLIGSVPVEPGDNPDTVRITGGPLAVAQLLEDVAAELRRKHAEPDGS